MRDNKILDQSLRSLHDAGLRSNIQIEMERRVCERVAIGIADEPAGRHHRSWPLNSRRRRRTLGLGLGLAGTLALGGGAYAILSPQPANLSSGLACFGNTERSGVMAAAQFDGRTAVAICTDLWRKGQLTAVPVGDRPGTAPTVPELQACVDPTDQLAVQVIPSPSPAICATYGLISKPNVGADSGPYATLTRTLHATLLKRCLSEPQALRVAHAALVTAKMPASWRITPTPGDLPARACVTIAIDTNTRTLTLLHGAPPIDNPSQTTPRP